MKRPLKAMRFRSYVGFDIDQLRAANPEYSVNHVGSLVYMLPKAPSYRRRKRAVPC